MNTSYKMLLIATFIHATTLYTSLAQPIYALKQSKIQFFAGTPVEDIDAVSTKTVSFLNIETGEVSISIPNKSFDFKRSLMQEHFNENYIESHKYPKSEFKGKIKDITAIDFTQKEPVILQIEGVLNIHGVSKARVLDVEVKNSEGKIEGNTVFDIMLEEHNINRPKILWEKIAEKVKVTATFVYEPYIKK